MLFTAESCRQILQDNRQPRTMYDCFARRLSSNDNLARYREDGLAIPLPGSASIETHQLAIRLSEAAETLLGKILSSMSLMSIFLACPGESAIELMSRSGK